MMNKIKNCFTLAFAVIGAAALLLAFYYGETQMYIMAGFCGLLGTVSAKQKV